MVHVTDMVDQIFEKQLPTAEVQSPEAAFLVFLAAINFAIRFFGEKSPVTTQLVKIALLLSTLIAAGLLLSACNQQPVSPNTQPTDSPTSPPISVPETILPTPKLVENAQQEPPQPTQAPSPTATEGVAFGGPITPEFITNILSTVGVKATSVENIVAGETVEWTADVTVDGKTVPVRATLVDGNLHIFVDGDDKGIKSASSGSVVVETATPEPGVYCTTDIRVRNGPGTAFDILKTCAAGTNFSTDQIEGVVNTPDQDVKQWLVLAGEPKQYIAVIPDALDIVGIDLTQLAEQPAPTAEASNTEITEVAQSQLLKLAQDWNSGELSEDAFQVFTMSGNPLPLGHFGDLPDENTTYYAQVNAVLLGTIKLPSGDHNNEVVCALLGVKDGYGQRRTILVQFGNTDDRGTTIGVAQTTNTDLNIANNEEPTYYPASEVEDVLLQAKVPVEVNVSFVFTFKPAGDTPPPPARAEIVSRVKETIRAGELLKRMLTGESSLAQIADEAPELEFILSGGIDDFARIAIPNELPLATKMYIAPK